MLKKTLAVVGASAVIVGGAGTAAIAASGTPAPAPPASSTTLASDDSADSSAASSATDSSAASAEESSANGSMPRAGKHRGVNRIRRAVHATWVTKNKETNAFTTHDAIRGRVTAVSPTSITVRAADNVTQTYVLNTGTKVHTRGEKGAASISDVKTGDPVFVGGTGTTTLTAVRVIDAKK